MSNVTAIGSARSTQPIVLDLFAGTGVGVAVQQLGGQEYGVEIMPEAVRSREAAGMTTIYNDAWDVDAAAPWIESWGETAWTLWASPPCQTFSAAGKGSGRKALDQVLAAIADGSWASIDRLRALGEAAGDERTALVLVPLHYIARYLPTFIALEQVPSVLPVWQAYATALRDLGYSVETAILNAEQYGVPQTRKRAILVARNDGLEAKLPTPTHSRYYPRKPQQLDEGVPKWVSMAEALGWGMTERPSMTVTGGGPAAGGAEPFGNGARQGMRREAERGAVIMRSNYGTSGDPANRGERTLEQPAPTLTSKAGRNRWVGTLAPTSVTHEEAAILQTFPADFPFQGGRGARFLQIGNAVPPLIARVTLDGLWNAAAAAATEKAAA